MRIFFRIGASVFLTADADDAWSPIGRLARWSGTVGLDGAARWTPSSAAMLGTPAHMSLEQIDSARDGDAASDQYAIGCRRGGSLGAAGA